MIDMHYDLLCIVYRDILRADMSYTEKWIKFYNKDNVTGLIANLCFETIEEMKEEYHPRYYDSSIKVLDMFKKSTSKLKEYVGSDINLKFGIEGCDYVDISDLEELHARGLSSINIVWNEKNKYASGVRYDGGLTELGKEFIGKAISLGIAIDLSHSNEETFYDIIDLVKEYRSNGYNPVVFASHSNSRLLCDVKRNLTDEELISLKEVDGYVGVMSNSNFIIKGGRELPREELRKGYLEHIDHIGNIIGFDHVMVSTDDMTFCSWMDPVYDKCPIYDYKNVRKELESDLLSMYSKEVSEGIMHGNASRMFDKLDVSLRKVK